LYSIEAKSGCFEECAVASRPKGTEWRRAVQYFGDGLVGVVVMVVAALVAVAAAAAAVEHNF
jgi:hypothetical protein